VISSPKRLTVNNAATDSYGLEVAIVWWSFGMLLVAAYFVYAYRLFFRPR
jgi:cytochrome bd-type quinol oxidase subunit 2